MIGERKDIELLLGGGGYLLLHDGTYLLTCITHIRWIYFLESYIAAAGCVGKRKGKFRYWLFYMYTSSATNSGHSSHFYFVFFAALVLFDSSFLFLSSSNKQKNCFLVINDSSNNSIVTRHWQFDSLLFFRLGAIQFRQPHSSCSRSSCCCCCVSIW